MANQHGCGLPTLFASLKPPPLIFSSQTRQLKKPAHLEIPPAHQLKSKSWESDTSAFWHFPTVSVMVMDGLSLIPTYACSLSKERVWNCERYLLGIGPGLAACFLAAALTKIKRAVNQLIVLKRIKGGFLCRNRACHKQTVVCWHVGGALMAWS